METLLGRRFLETPSSRSDGNETFLMRLKDIQQESGSIVKKADLPIVVNITDLQKLQLVRARIWQISMAGQSEASAEGSP